MKRLLLPVICALLLTASCKKDKETFNAEATYSATAFTEKGCFDPGTVMSINSLNAIEITFTNNTKNNLSFFWIDYSAEEKFYKELEPGQSWVCPTFLTHPWMVRKADNSCATILIPKAGAAANETVTFEE
ncbi:MAG: hypothetical protein KA149_02755 [Chitinophagales bacterium]|nr:hypothetical protein [Chitinophagales bacterium]